MNSLHEFQESQDIESWLVHRRELVEDYLDHLCAPLIGLVPYPQRQSLRLEVEGHLWALIDEYEQEGFDREEATAATLREHGEPWRIGQTFLEEWCRGGPQQPLGRYGGLATLRAFAYSGIASVPLLLLTQIYTLFASDASPYEWFYSTPYLLVLMLAPWISGILTGATTPVRPVPATIRAVGALVLVSCGAGLLMLPYTEGLSFALYQLLYWLPAGCLSSWLGATLAVCHRRHRFLSIRRATTGRSG